MCKFSELQYNSLAFVAGLKMPADEGSLPEIAQYSPYYLPLNYVFTASKGSNLYILFIELSFQMFNNEFLQAFSIEVRMGRAYDISFSTAIFLKNKNHEREV